MIGIYCIKNLVNGKLYIGQSTRIKARLDEHKRDLRNNRHYNSHLQAAWNKYGKNSFAFDIVEECSIQCLDDREVYWIAYYNSCVDGYNNTLGGQSNQVVSKETRLKLKAALTGRIMNDNWRQNLSKAKLGKRRGPLSDNHKDKIRQALKNQIISQEQRDKISSTLKGSVPWNKGRKMTAEEREHLKQTRKKRPPVSEETKEKMRLAHLGNKNACKDK